MHSESIAKNLMANPVLVSIIDDDQSVRLALCGLLRSVGLETQVFGSVEKFLAANADKTSACIITDIQMPGMSGLQLQSILVQKQCTVPLIFMTAFPEESIRKRALAAGAAYFLSKPFDSEEMIRCITWALNTHG